MPRNAIVSLCIWSTVAGCTGDSDGAGIAALGGLSHDLSAVEVTVVATDQDGLNVPRDLAFNPEVPGELWIVNQADDSVTIIFDATSASPTSDHIVDPYAFHFMEEVSSIAFGAPGTFGTCQESENTYNDQQQGNDFMGPTLWSSDLAIFGESNPDAVSYLSDLFGFNVDLGSHLDMVHESPLCMGIAWDSDNVYWVLDGESGAIDRVDFKDDHGAGFDDHSDGETAIYVEGKLGRVDDVPSHMELDRAGGLLWIADTGNNRVVALDTESGTRGDDKKVTEPGTTHYEMDDATLYLMIDGSDFDMIEPSGLAIHDDIVYVGDHGTGRLWAFDLDGGEVDYLDLGLTGLMGIEVVGPDDIWVIASDQDGVIRLQPAD